MYQLMFLKLYVMAIMRWHRDQSSLVTITRESQKGHVTLLWP